MKKIYISPNLLTVELHATNMMALSLNGDELITTDNIDEYEQNTKEFNSSSNGSIWDDEW